MIDVRDVVVFCPHPQMRPTIERTLLDSGCRVRSVIDVAAFRALIHVLPPNTAVVLVALSRDDLVAALMDELPPDLRDIWIIRSTQTPKAIAEQASAERTLTIPYDDRQLADFCARLARRDG